MKYEVVCSKSYLDVGLLIEQNDKLEPKRILARASTYRRDGEYGVYAGMTWVKTGVFLSKDEWIEISYNKPTDQILRELGINKENNQGSIDEDPNIKDIKKYINYLDEMVDFLDEEDELAGLPNGVFEAYEKLEWYFTTLYGLRSKEKVNK